MFITKDDIEPDTGMQLAKTNRAEELRSGIALLKMVRAVHDAAEINAMAQGKHMARFMNQDLAASFQ